jgi:drug/metabolite transporter (DMT)-like permease
MNRAADIVLPALETPAPARPWLDAFELGLLGAIWGASFLFQRVSAPEFGALPLGELRLVLGAAVLLPFLWRDRAFFPLSLWPRIALVGAINSAIPFALFAWAAQRAPAGVIAISNSMAVLFTALVAFAGVVVLAGAKTAGMSLGWAVAAGTSAAFLYGIGVNLIRHWLAGLPPVALAAGTLSCAAIALAPFAFAAWPAGPKSAAAWGSALALGVICSGLAYAMYYRLIQRIGGARAVTVTYLVPLFAVVWAWWLLGERPTLPMLLAGALILGSVALSQSRR